MVGSDFLSDWKSYFNDEAITEPELMLSPTDKSMMI